MFMVNLFCIISLAVKTNTIVTSENLLAQIFPFVRKQIRLILKILRLSVKFKPLINFFSFVIETYFTLVKKHLVKLLIYFFRMRFFRKKFSSVCKTTCLALIKKSAVSKFKKFLYYYKTRVFTNTVFNVSACHGKTIYTFINVMIFIAVNALKSTGITFFAGRHTIGTNVLQICDGRDFYHKCLCGAQNFRLPLNCLRSTKPRLLQMCCYLLPFFLSKGVSIQVACPLQLVIFNFI